MTDTVWSFASGTIQVLVALVAVGTFVFYVVYERRARKTQLSAMYLQRYWEISDGLLTDPKGEQAHTHHVHRLLILTEDEFDAARSGLLDPNYWEKWHGWIAHPSQRETRFHNLGLVHAKPPDFEHLRECLGDPELKISSAHTWKQCPARQTI